MAKQIVTIRCPQCGSTQQTKIKDDYYLCTNCNAEYILDNENINVNIKHQYSGENKTANSKNIKAVFFTFIFTLAILLAIIIFNIPFTDSKSHRREEMINDRFSGISIAHYSTKPIALFLTERRYEMNYNDKDNPKNGMYLVFYDLENKAYLKDYRINNIPFDDARPSIYRGRYFSGMNKNYVILNETNILEVDFENLTFIDITDQMLNRFDEFDAGIATIDFDYQDKDNAFKIVTNLGKNYTYYPYINYLKDNDVDRNKSKIDQDKLVDSIYYTFTKKSLYFPEIPIQLMRVTYKRNIGGPSTHPSTMKWKRDYTSNKPDAKILDHYYQKYVVSVEDITPERHYFDPEVLFQNGKTLLIKYKPTVAPDAPTLFQLLNLDTQEPIWTQQLPPSFDFRYVQEVGLTDKYYVISQGLFMFHLIPLDGGEIESFKIPNRH